MKGKKLLNRIKAAVTGIVVAATALVPMTAVETQVIEAASSVNYAKALQYSLYLYDANMCGGQVGETSQLNWRDDCHTYDSAVSTPYGTLDLSGGFHDAGDHVKFGLPGAYSATMLGWGYYEFKDAYTKTGQAGHLQTITDYFCDYFKRCTVMSGSSVQAFCYQVGDGDTDHAKWCSPESQTLARPAYFATSSNPCTDVVAETAAALAMNYINFGNSEDLTYAKALYAFAKSNNKANHQSQSYYTGTSYLDDLALASILLYKATNTSSYKSDCANWISQSNYAYTSDYPLCWDSVWPAVNAIYANEWNRVSANVDTNKNSFNTSGGYACRDNWGSARYNTATQLVGLVYDKYKNSSTYSAWAKGQMEYLFGNNSAGYCYMVGYDSNSVTEPHHRAASGYSNFPSENQGVPFKHVLVGALVGGPDSNDSYVDDVEQYKYTEVATDYNAAFVGALAGLYLKYGSGQSIASSVPGVDGGSTQPTTTTTTPKVTTTTTTTIKTTTVSTSNNQGGTTTTTTAPSSEGSTVVNVNTQLDSSDESKKMYQISLSELVPSGAKAEQIIVKLNTSESISYGGGISVTSNADNWVDLTASSVNSGKYVFDVSSIQDEIEYGTGIFQFGYWWGNSPITIESVTCIYSMEGASVTTITTAPKVTTTTSTTIRTTTTTRTTTAPSSEGSTVVNVNTQLDSSDESKKLFKISLSELVPSGAKAEKIIVKLNTSDSISYGGGISVTSNADNWLDLTASSVNSGKYVFDVSSIQDEIEYGTGIFQFGCWWSNSPITIESVTCEYSLDNQGNSTTTPSTTTAIKTTTSTTTSSQGATVPNVTATKYGDVNDDKSVDVADVVAINMYLLNSTTNSLSDVSLANSDCAKNGVIDSSDSVLIMNYVAMIINYSQLGK
ncbi:MAG: glycoside hydrolase family 9 protein [Oscillospiraceae bacterium]|nr:glycoside hydrolase family 9 protein [Oscillospiraceae bacterium]